MSKDALDTLLDEEIAGWEEEVKALEKQIPGTTDDDDSVDDEPETDIEDDDESEIDDDAGESDALLELKKQFEESEKQRRGIYNELKSERRARQELTEQISNYHNTLNQILQQRQAASPTAAAPSLKGIPLEFDDDGDAFIPEDKLAAMTAPQIKALQEKIDNLQKSMQATQGTMQQQYAAQTAINKILSEDERFFDAWPVYQKARAWANDVVINWQQDNDVGGIINSGDALQYIFDQSTRAKFEKAFPGVNIEDIVTAEDNEYFLKRTLRGLADVLFQEDDEPVVKPKRTKDSKFEKVLKKPNGLGAAANKRGSGKSIAEVAESLSGVEALDLTDAQAEALLRSLEREEKVNGITF